MSAFKMSVKHGQPFEVAKANFEKGITSAAAQFGQFIKTVDWADDRTAARLGGPGFSVDLKVDAEAVHASGEVPFFVRFMEGPIRKFVEQTLKSGETPPKLT